MKRVLTALVAGSLAIVAVLFASSAWVFAIALALMLGCALEFLALGRRIHPDLPRPPLLLALPLVAVAWLVPSGAWAAVLALTLLASAPLVFAVLMLPRAGAFGSAVGALGWMCFGLPYLVLPVWALYEIHQESPRLLVLLLVVVWLNDSFAFWVGSTWGRRKLAPRLSPGKTWEGSVAGLVGGTGVAVLGLARLEGATIELLGLFVVAIVAAQLGDLVESMLKRAASVKDSGTLVPGHGGLLDRLDAIILAAPVFYGLLEATGIPVG